MSSLSYRVVTEKKVRGGGIRARNERDAEQSVKEPPWSRRENKSKIFWKNKLKYRTEKRESKTKSQRLRKDTDADELLAIPNDTHTHARAHTDLQSDSHPRSRPWYTALHA